MGPVAGGTVRATLVLGLRVVIQAANLLILARIFGPASYASFAAAVALAIILGTVAMLGMQNLFLGAIAGGQSQRDDVLVFAIPTALVTGLTLLGVYLLGVGYAIGNAQASPGLVALLAVGIAELLFAPLLTLSAMDRLSRGLVARSQLLRVLPLGLRLGAAAFLWFIAPARPVGTYAVLYATTTFVVLVGAILVPSYQMPSPGRWRPPSIRELKSAAGFGCMNICSSATTEVDKAIAPHFLALEVAGAFSVAGRIIDAICLPVSAMMTSALPVLFQDGRQGHSRQARLLVGLLAVSALYAVALAVGIWVIAPLVARLFGEAYTHLTEILRTFCWAVPAMALRMVVGNILMSRFLPTARAAMEGGGCLAVLILAAPLSDWSDDQGLVAAVVAAEWAMMSAGLVMLWRLRSRQDQA